MFGVFLKETATDYQILVNVKPYRTDRMMINHSTLEYHVTNLNTFFRWLWRKKSKP